MKRNSERSSPTPSPPRPATCVASVSPPMFARTSTRVPSRVTAGSSACARFSLRRCSARSCALADADDFFRRRVQPQRAVVAVEDHDGAVRHVERGRLDTSQRRDAQRSSEDGDVRRGAAASGAKADHARAVERCGVRRREIFRDEDGVRRILSRLAGVHAGQRPTARAAPTSRTSLARCASS